MIKTFEDHNSNCLTVTLNEIYDAWRFFERLRSTEFPKPQLDATMECIEFIEELLIGNRVKWRCTKVQERYDPNQPKSDTKRFAECQNTVDDVIHEIVFYALHDVGARPESDLIMGNKILYVIRKTDQLFIYDVPQELKDILRNMKAKRKGTQFDL